MTATFTMHPRLGAKRCYTCRAGRRLVTSRTELPVGMLVLVGGGPWSHVWTVQHFRRSTHGTPVRPSASGDSLGHLSSVSGPVRHPRWVCEDRRPAGGR